MNQENSSSIFKKLPQEVWQRIYLFDPTYRDMFHECIQEMDWKILLSNKVELEVSNNIIHNSVLHPSDRMIRIQMLINMAQTLPYFLLIGCKPTTFSHGS